MAAACVEVNRNIIVDLMSIALSYDGVQVAISRLGIIVSAVIYLAAFLPQVLDYCVLYFSILRGFRELSVSSGALEVVARMDIDYFSHSPCSLLFIETREVILIDHTHIAFYVIGIRSVPGVLQQRNIASRIIGRFKKSYRNFTQLRFG